MPAMSVTTKQQDFYVPTINIAPYLQDPTSPAAQEIIGEVRRACLSTGFFQITGHGISKELQQRIFRAATEFFNLSPEQKQKLDCMKTVGYRGYDVLATQSYEEGVSPDLKEGFYVGEDIPPSHPLHARFFSGPNVWPPSELLPTEVFQTPCEQYFAQLQALSLEIIHLIGASLLDDADEDEVELSRVNRHVRVPAVLNDLACLDASLACPMRLLHYPSVKGQAAAVEKPQYGASAHTDFSAITLLLQDENPGLEVLDTSPAALATDKNIWRPINPNPDAYVVNIGDIIHKVTSKAYKSSIHRVVCKRPENERYSIVFFTDGRLDTKLRSVKSALVNAQAKGPSYANQTVEQHMIERLTMSYGSGKKDARRDGETVVV